MSGKYKNVDNVIEERDEAGNKKVRFQPVPAWETKESMEALCESYGRTKDEDEADPLLLIPMFVLDFLCIHPFKEGNGRAMRIWLDLIFYQELNMVIDWSKIDKEDYLLAME